MVSEDAWLGRRYVELRTVESTDGNNIVLNKNGFIGIYNDKDGRELERHPRRRHAADHRL